MLLYYNGIRRRHHLTWSGILPPNRSPWRHLYENGDDGSFLNLTGFSRAAFEEMHNFLYEDHNERHGAGRPRLLNTHDELGIILFYLGSCMTLNELCIWLHSYSMQLCCQQLQFLSRKLRQNRESKKNWSSTLGKKSYLVT